METLTSLSLLLIRHLMPESSYDAALVVNQDSAPLLRKHVTLQALHLEECKDLTNLALEPVALQQLALGGCPSLCTLRVAAPQLQQLELKCAPAVASLLLHPVELWCKSSASMQSRTHLNPVSPDQLGSSLSLCALRVTAPQLQQLELKCAPAVDIDLHMLLCHVLYLNAAAHCARERPVRYYLNYSISPQQIKKSCWCRGCAGLEAIEGCRIGGPQAGHSGRPVLQRAQRAATEAAVYLSGHTCIPSSGAEQFPPHMKASCLLQGLCRPRGHRWELPQAGHCGRPVLQRAQRAGAAAAVYLRAGTH